MNQKTSKVEKEFYLRCSYLTLSVLFDKEPETNGLSIQETAKKFNIGSNRTLSKWIEQYEEGGASSLESQKRGRKISMNSKLNIPKKLKDESLEEEVIRLRAENAYLKKWNGNTFFDKNYKVL
ncbi:helix-turn-helix domain-containing protein [Enterococcus faecium]|nr:helix-turn-helix domain-containing protein [Enterococcus faecium]EOG17104.1 hypothetical protein SM5_00770 [Enterococcus faecium EnGen0177]